MPAICIISRQVTEIKIMVASKMLKYYSCDKNTIK